MHEHFFTLYILLYLTNLSCNHDIDLYDLNDMERNTNFTFTFSFM